MDQAKKDKLQEQGWQVGTVDQFLGLAPEEAAYIELKLSLAAYLRRRRQEKQLTQIELANLLHSSQSRVAKMEAGDPTVSLDLLIRSLLTLGTTQADLAQVLSANG